MSLLPFRVELYITLLDEGKEGAQPLHTHVEFSAPTDPEPHPELQIMALLTASNSLIESAVGIKDREGMSLKRLERLTDFVAAIPTTATTDLNPEGKE